MKNIAVCVQIFSKMQRKNVSVFSASLSCKFPLRCQFLFFLSGVFNNVCGQTNCVCCDMIMFSIAQKSRLCNSCKCLIGSIQSLLYCQFCHMYRTYIQRIEIALLSYSYVVQSLSASVHLLWKFCSSV